MPTPTKRLENMDKHLTAAEIEARDQAERAAMPARLPARPKTIGAKSPERKIWDRILRDMADFCILDRLDTDALTIYCSQVVRWQKLSDMMRLQLTDFDELTPGDVKAFLSRDAEMQQLERSILSYASKLGLTPDGRARLARRLAEQEPDDPDGDLFA